MENWQIALIALLIVIGYVAIGYLLLNILRCMRFVMFFVVALITRAPMDVDDVNELGEIEWDDTLQGIAGVFWPIALSFYILWYALHDFPVAVVQSWKNSDFSIKWLSLSQLVKYSNKVLGIKVK